MPFKTGEAPTDHPRIKEATSGYFSDYNRARSASGGKLWTAPPVLIREDVSAIASVLAEAAVSCKMVEEGGEGTA